METLDPRKIFTIAGNAFIIETEEGNIFLSLDDSNVETDTIVSKEEIEGLIEDHVYAVHRIEERLKDKLPSYNLIYLIQKIVLNKALEYFREKYIGKKVSLKELDDEMYYNFAIRSIFQEDIDTKFNSFCWMYYSDSGFNFHFDSLKEVAEGNKDQKDIYVTVEGIELI